MFNSSLLTLNFINILPLHALRLQMPSAVVLIRIFNGCSVSVNDLLFSDTANRQFQIS